MVTISRSARTLVTAIAVLGALSACSSSSSEATDSARLPTAECKGALADAGTRLEAHYAKWAVVDPDEFDQEEAEWQAAIDPLYDACSSAEDFMAAGKLYPAVFGVTAAQYVDVPTIQIYCSGNEGRPACDGVGELS